VGREEQKKINRKTSLSDDEEDENDESNED